MGSIPSQWGHPAPLSCRLGWIETFSALLFLDVANQYSWGMVSKPYLQTTDAPHWCTIMEFPWHPVLNHLALFLVCSCKCSRDDPSGELDRWVLPTPILLPPGLCGCQPILASHHPVLLYNSPFKTYNLFGLQDEVYGGIFSDQWECSSPLSCSQIGPMARHPFWSHCDAKYNYRI